MKSLFVATFLLFSFCSFGQVVGEIRPYDPSITWLHPIAKDTIKKAKCEIGYSWMPSLSSSGMRIEADKCLPDSICKELWLAYRKNLCEETSFASMGGNYSISSQNTWASDSIGCVNKTTYKKRSGKVWVEITACQYYFENTGTKCWLFDGKTDKQIPCCACKELHTSAQPEWK